MSIEISNAVIHVLDREANEPLLNEYELEINEDVYNFLEKHISKSINDDEARLAKFREGGNLIKDACSNIFRDGSFFLDSSKEIARQLFKAIKTNNSISSSDLIICLCKIDQRFNIAIFKMDYNTSFIHEVEMLEDRYRISIKKQEIGLPGTGQKIQKCAFISNTDIDTYNNLVVLDNQINSKTSDEPVAQFFLQTFLGAELVTDNRSNTKIFKKETENWIREKVKEGENSVENIREFAINTIRQDEEINIDEFAQKAFGNAVYLRDEFIGNMKEKGITEEKLVVDKEWVERKLSKVKLKTESGIEVSISYELFNDKEKFEIEKNPDGTRNIIIKNIIGLIEK